jgi:hypothetical protein
MSNQVILWSSLVVPWLTLIFMKKESIKRYMPVAFLAIVTSVLIYDIGFTFGLWIFRETVFPFYQQMPFFFGAMPVLTMWVLHFTFGQFGAYMLMNLILDIVFNFFLLGIFLPGRGILELSVSPYRTLPITLVHAIMLYGYQIWQERIWATSERSRFSAAVQPAAAKPLPEDLKDTTEK